MGGSGGIDNLVADGVPVPEPTAAALLGLGLARARRRTPSRADRAVDPAPGLAGLRLRAAAASRRTLPGRPTGGRKGVPCLSAASPFHQFQGTQGYIASAPLVDAVNCAIALERPLLDQGRAGHRQDAARAPRRRGARHADGLVAHQVDHQGGRRPLRLRHGPAPERRALRRRRRRDIRRYIKLGPLGRAFAAAAAPRAADRRGRQGRPRVPERPAARARRDALHGARDRRRGRRDAAAGRDHHLEQREGAARRVPAPLRLPLHRVPRRRR